MALFAFSNSFIRKNKYWPNHHHIVGFFHIEEEWWSPDPELVQFIENGPPPIVVTFSSMVHEDPEALRHVLVKSIRQLNCRGIILNSRAQWWPSQVGPEKTSEDKSLYFADFIPYGWLFPKASVVVHHGGMGTVGEALRAGVPSVVIPHCFDHPMWDNLFEP